MRKRRIPYAQLILEEIEATGTYEPKDKTLKIRVSESERESVVEKAIELGITQSEVFRRLIRLHLADLQP